MHGHREFDLYEAIYTTRSMRRLKPDPVSPELIVKVIEAATMGPSGHNRQPWFFIVVTEREAFGIIGRQLLQVLAPPVLFFQYREQLAMVQPFGILEVNRHLLAKCLIAVGNDIKQIADWNDVTHLERVPLIDEQLHHDFERGPFALEHTGDRDQRLH